MPYLDSGAQAIFQRPLEVARCPEDVGVDPPRVRIHATAKQRRALLHKLDETDRLGLVGESQIVPGYQAGLFSIMKDLSTASLRRPPLADGSTVLLLLPIFVISNCRLVAVLSHLARI